MDAKEKMKNYGERLLALLAEMDADGLQVNSIGWRSHKMVDILMSNPVVDGIKPYYLGKDNILAQLVFTENIKITYVINDDEPEYEALKAKWDNEHADEEQ